MTYEPDERERNYDSDDEQAEDFDQPESEKQAPDTTAEKTSRAKNTGNRGTGSKAGSRTGQRAGGKRPAPSRGKRPHRPSR